MEMDEHGTHVGCRVGENLQITDLVENLGKT